MKSIMRDYFRIYFVAFIAAMFAYYFDWIDKGHDIKIIRERELIEILENN